MHSLHTLPRIALTMGDVNGVGPEILVKALSRQDVREVARCTVYGDKRVLDAAQARVGVHLADPPEVFDGGHAAPEVAPGVLSEASGDCAHAWITAAVHDIQRGKADALVTAPVNKEAMLLAGHGDLGHTELLARLTGVDDWRMCLYTRGRLVVHLTGHLPTRAALDAITPDAVLRSIRMAHDALLRTGVDSPRIAVAGINPHAGEHGCIGDDEERLLVQPIAKAQEQGINCTGPHSPDAIFRALWEGRHDAVIAMYHDQGHIAMKMVAMDEGVSVTLGLPFVRTSPDHGTAFDIAWQGVAREDSMAEAIKLAAALARKPE